VTTCRFNWACYCDNVQDGDLRNFEAVFYRCIAGYSAGDRQCLKPHRSRCAHDRTGSQEPGKVPLDSEYIQLLTGGARMAGKGTWKDEAQHARDMGLSEERQGDARHAAVGMCVYALTRR
jgi:hypothetical protein